MPRTALVIGGLLAGLVLGMLFGHYDLEGPARFARAIEPVGLLWLSALRMCVVPLVIALLITSVASAAETARTGRLAGTTVASFAVLQLLLTILGAAITLALLAAWPVADDARAALVAGAAPGAAPEGVGTMPGFALWLTNLVPVNPIAAAAEARMLPLVVFALFVGFAASRLAGSGRRTLVEFFHAITEAMLVIVGWVLLVAPIGVFVLALGVGLRGGPGAASAIGQYVFIEIVVGCAITLAMYPLAGTLGGTSLRRFARAAAPAQVVAVSTQSSLASLPAMLAGARQLGVPEPVYALVLPLAVSLFRATSGAMNLAVALFIAHVHGVEITAGMLAAGILVATVNSLNSMSLPGQASFFTGTVPVALAMGLPLELLPLLLAVEVIPDIFRTIGNVTADLAVTTLVARRAALSDPIPP